MRPVIIVILELAMLCEVTSFNYILFNFQLIDEEDVKYEPLSRLTTSLWICIFTLYPCGYHIIQTFSKLPFISQIISIPSRADIFGHSLHYARISKHSIFRSFAVLDDSLMWCYTLGFVCIRLCVAFCGIKSFELSNAMNATLQYYSTFVVPTSFYQILSLCIHIWYVYYCLSQRIMRMKLRPLDFYTAYCYDSYLYSAFWIYMLLVFKRQWYLVHIEKPIRESKNSISIYYG